MNTKEMKTNHRNIEKYTEKKSNLEPKQQRSAKKEMKNCVIRSGKKIKLPAMETLVKVNGVFSGNNLFLSSP